MQENIPYYPLKSSARGLDFSVSSSSSIPISEQIHYHDYYQIYYIRQGYIFHHVGDRHLKLARGDCFINSPYTPHRIEMGPNTAFISFSFRSSFIPPSITSQPEFQRFTSNLQFSDLNADAGCRADGPADAADVPGILRDQFQLPDHRAVHAGDDPRNPDALFRRAGAGL